MCSIYGALLSENNDKIRNTVAATFAAASERGRDSWGVDALSDRGSVDLGRSMTGRGQLDLRKFSWIQAPLALIGSRRAEPTTERVVNKRSADVAPFCTPSGWYFAHNGTISNDRELRQQLATHPRRFTPATAIDSAVIGLSLECLGWEEGVRALEGSFAIIAAHATDLTTLRFAVNYKPLFAAASEGGRIIQLASQPHYFPTSDSPLLEPGPIEIPPYSIGSIRSDGSFACASLYPPAQPRRRVLALCSGGLDATVAAWKHHAEGDEVTLLYIDYACRAGGREREAVERIAERMGRPAVVIPLSFFADAAPSPLTDTRLEIQTARGGEAAAELGHEWVPARNTVLLALALAYAEAHGFDAIALGTNLEESGGGYPDNEQEFVNKVARLAPYALKPYCRVEISQPCGTLMKHEIVALGHAIGAPIDLSWSCYEGGMTHCGRCGPCWMRQVAHVMQGLMDPVFVDRWAEIEATHSGVARSVAVAG